MLSKFTLIICTNFIFLFVFGQKLNNDDNSNFEWNKDSTIYINKFNSLDGFDYFSDNIKDASISFPKLYNFNYATWTNKGKMFYFEIKLAYLIELQKEGGESVIVWNFKNWQNYCFIRLGNSEKSNLSYIQIGRKYNGIEELSLESGSLRFEKRGFESCYYGVLIDLDDLKSKIYINQNNSKATSYVLGESMSEICEVPLTNDFISNIGVTSYAMSIKIDQVLCAFKKETKEISNVNKNLTKTGSGIAITLDGFVVTNNHVVENGKSFQITLESKTFNAKLIKVDKSNDLAILKIVDSTFKNFKTIPFVIKKSNAQLGEKVFSLGYPMTQIQGFNVKLTEGIVSSITGFQDDPVCYQISVPLQPGNSGGPLFDDSGNIVGIVNAGILEANSVGYAIKSNYLLNFLDVIPEFPTLNTKNALVGISFTQKVKELTKYSCLITVKY